MRATCQRITVSGFIILRAFRHVLMEIAVTVPRMIIRIKGAKWKCSHPSF